MKKSTGLHVSAVIVAAGKGTRMNMELNKQYIEICGKPVLARTLQVFEDCDNINDIILVVNGQDILYCKEYIVERYGFKKVTALVSGGDTRQKSVFNGLNELRSTCDIVLIHDGARPFVREESLIDSINAAREFGAACVAVPVKDTVKTADTDGFIKETLDRSCLWAIQTPQTFVYNLIIDAHRRAEKDGFAGTDDAVLVERLGCRTKLVMGSYDNIKITTREDLVVAEAIVNNNES